MASVLDGIPAAESRREDVERRHRARPQGTGKSTVFQQLAKICGDYSTVLNQRGLEDKVQFRLVRLKLFILAEEVVTRAEMAHQNELKELSAANGYASTQRTSPPIASATRSISATCRMRASRCPSTTTTAGTWWYIPAGPVWEYYDDVFLEIEAGGVAALYQYLLDLDLTGFTRKKRPPMTDAKQRLMMLSSPSEVRFATEWITGEFGLPVCPALAGDVYAAYPRWCRANGESRPRPSNHFHGSLAHLSGWEKKARVFRAITPLKPKVKPILFPPVANVGPLETGRFQEPGPPAG